jgi:hypothetical protein
LTFGEKLPQCRKQKKASQQHKLPGICGDVIGRYERDVMKDAKKLADVLEVSLDYLVGDTELKILDKKILQTHSGY